MRTLQQTLTGKITSNAILSACGQYRYTLERNWNDHQPTVMFIGLNPSTADAVSDDPTVRRMVGFAQRWGYGKLYLGNLFAFRSTDPSQLPLQRDPVGPENDHYLVSMASHADRVIAAWGAHGTLQNRGEAVRKIIPNLFHLGLTNNNQPKHPLYLPKTTPFQKWA